VAEICKTAGVPKGSFYYFFESKEALALAVIEEHWAAERREWTRIPDGDAEPLESDTHAAAQSVVAQLEGQVLFAKLYNNVAPLGSLWANCLALLGAQAPART
jgi:AcrR family transcriptional regulator